MHLSKQYVTLEACKAAYERDNLITIDENMICVQNANPGKSACFGDSGGPLYDSVENKLIGVVSTGPSDCADRPIIYSRIASGYEWIKETICENHSEPKPELCFAEPSSAPSSTPVQFQTPTPPLSKKTQHTYFQIMSLYNTTNETKWCLAPVMLAADSQVVAQVCDDTSSGQLWKLGDSNQIRNMANVGLCLNNLQSDTPGIITCSDKDRVLIFDAFQQSLLLIKNQDNFKKLGLMALSLTEAPTEGNFSPIKVNFRALNGRSDLQKWHGVYPDL